MRKRILIPSIFFVFMIFNTSPGVIAGEFSSGWQAYTAEHSQDKTIAAVITMADQVNLRSLQDSLYLINADRRLWHEVVVRALQLKALVTQAEILSALADLQAQGQVVSYRGLWIGNLVIAKATVETFNLLCERPDVEQISPDYPLEPIAPVKRSADNGNAITRVENGLVAIKADSCWAIGITGEGRLVSNLDTGIDGTHPALAGRWRGTADPRYGDHPEWAWCDPVYHSRFPGDSGGIPHGTITMGIVCGRDSQTGDTIGVAIGAQWIGATMIGRYDDIDDITAHALEALQWTADPDGDPSTVWDVPDVNNGSWGFAPEWLPDSCDERFWVAIDGCEAAGVAVIFSAGNEGPNSRSIRNPANRAVSDFSCFSVGAVNAHNTNFPIAEFSSRGPARCTPDGFLAIKPEISAPGVNIRSSVPGGYISGDGTSEAAPHVAGVVALIRQANPDLSTEQVYQVLMETAVDRGPSGDDNSYGRGVVNAYHAVLLAMEMARGVFMGVIRDSLSQTPVENALVRAVNHNPPLEVFTGADGSFMMRLPYDSLYNILIEKAPLYQSISDTIMILRPDTLVRDYALYPLCQYTIGDINGSGMADGLDIAYAVNYFKGGAIPETDCRPICAGEQYHFYAAGDVNGNCAFNGIDIVYFVRYLKGQEQALSFCADCPPGL
jgi:bacillopeptidase F